MNWDIEDFEIEIQDTNQVKVDIENVEEDLAIIHFQIENLKISKENLKIKWHMTAMGMHYRWHSKINLIKACTLDWFKNINMSNALTGAPVECMMDFNNTNKLTWAFSDTIHQTKITSLIVEESGQVCCTLELFKDKVLEGKPYTAELRIDTRNIPYYEALQGVEKWWGTYEYNKPAFVPECANKPMYSTWYTYHQKLSSQELIDECRQAKKYGCEAIIVDDGWQTDDNNRGYAYCGDWEVATSKIPDMRTLVEEVHQIGMKFMVWYPVPFIGTKSKNFERFKDMLVTYITDEWAVLDPRYKEVREFIIETYEKALLDWDLDGFKLDFIDEFVVNGDDYPEPNEKRDIEGLLEASDKLLKECLMRLRKIKPDVMIEFRQTYTGPAMRSYGNIFRAVDCPMDAFENRVRTTDIRLLNGKSATHADMIMWHLEDTVESAAMQLTNIFFSVPQISVKIEDLQPSHKRMLKFYLDMWNKYQQTIVKGQFMPLNPFNYYNILKVVDEQREIIGYYSSSVVTIEENKKEIVIINSTLTEECIVKVRETQSFDTIIIYNCEGVITESYLGKLIKGIHTFNVPPAGIIVCQSNQR
ncbi:glycoside hydrolase family 36 protein [Niameybacter massiliensis]|uniref:glycoside hydrolase family 36 protein n=1 Tax=Niameybacter massiliensis TaxID=1658108 RepID=UPI0006B4AB2C|nr:glycoside hydrolase family 36 protein [Niameybacter massiliensis]